MKFIALPIVSLLAAILLFIPVTGLWLFIAYKNPELLKLFAKSDLTTIINRTSSILLYQLSVKEIINLILVSFGIPFALFGIILVRSSQKSQYANAKWAEYRDVKKSGLTKSKGIFVGRYGGFFITHPYETYIDPRTQNRKRVRLLLGGTILNHEGNGNGFVIAPPSGGKGSSSIIPALSQWDYSAVVVDIRGETYETTAKLRSEYSKIFLFAPLEQNSHAYNPLDFVRPEPGIREQDIAEIAEALIPEGKGEADYWVKDARQLIRGVISMVLEYPEIPKAAKNLRTCMDIIQGKRDILSNIDNMMVKYVNFSSYTITQLRPYLTMNDRQFDGLYGNVRTALNPYINERILAATDRSDFDIRTFKKTCKTLYIFIRPTQKETLLPLANILISQLASALSQDTLKQDERPVLMLLDEFSNLGRINQIVTLFTTGGGNGVSTWIFVQTLTSVDSVYGVSVRKTLIDSSAFQMFMGSQDTDSLVHFERLLGKHTIQTTIKQVGGAHGAGAQVRSEVVPLFSLEQLRTLSSDKVIILPQGQKPIMGTRNYWFCDPAIIKAVKKHQNKILNIPDSLKTVRKENIFDCEVHFENEPEFERPVDDKQE